MSEALVLAFRMHPTKNCFNNLPEYINKSNTTHLHSYSAPLLPNNKCFWRPQVLRAISGIR